MALHEPSSDPVEQQHPVSQSALTLIVIDDDRERSIEGIRFDVGKHGITRIEPIAKCGEYSHIPYFRVWRGNSVVGEFCQHKCLGVFYASSETIQDSAQ